MAFQFRCEICGKTFVADPKRERGPMRCPNCRPPAADDEAGPAKKEEPAQETIFVSLSDIEKPKAGPKTADVPNKERREEALRSSLGELRKRDAAPQSTRPPRAPAPARQPRPAPPPRMRPATEVGVGIIGVGFMGQLHAKALQQVHGARLVGVADASGETAATVARQFGVHSDVTPEGLARRADVDCVIIATNDESHVEPVAAAASAGKHILLEKPIATTLADADKIIRICEDAKVKLMIGFVLRFDKRYARVKEAVAAGEIGEMESLFCRRTNLVTSQDRLKGRVSVLSFLGVHDFDIMRWVAGSEVKRVHTEAVWNLHRKNGHNVEDTTWTLLRFQNGVIGSLETGWIMPTTFPTKADFKLEAVGTGGMIQYDLTKQELVFTKPDGHYSERFNPMLQYEIEHFLDCVRNDTAPLVTGADGRAALEISLAAQLSSREERIVELPLR